MVGMIALLLSALVQDLPPAPPGWTVERVASSPATRLCAAADGRIFAAEGPRVVSFGPGGKRTEVAAGLVGVTGLVHVGGKLLVHDAGRVLVLPEGRELFRIHPDPRAGDGSLEHAPANLRAGPDGFVYLAVGDKGLHGGPVTLRGGGVLRFRPDGSGVEVFATGLRSPVDLAFAPGGGVLLGDSGDGRKWSARLLHVVDGGDYGYPWGRPPGTVADLGAAEPVGVVRRGDRLYVADRAASRIEWFRLRRSGETWKAGSRGVLLSGFTPEALAEGPEGTLLAAGGGSILRLAPGTPAADVPEGPGGLRQTTELGRTGEAGAVPALLERLGSGDPVLGKAAVAALRRVAGRHPEAWSAVVEAGGRALEAVEDRVEAVPALVEADPTPDRVRALGRLRLNPGKWNGDWWGRRPALLPPPPRSVAHARTGQVAEALRRALVHDDASVRRAAAGALRQPGDAPLLKERLAAERDPAVRGAILRALAALDPGAAEEFSEEVLRYPDRHPELMGAATDVAARLGGPDLRRRLRRALRKDLPVEALLRILSALAEVGSPSEVEAVRGALEHGDVRVVVAAVRALGGIGQSSVRSLLPLLDDSRPEVWEAVAVALGRIEEANAVPGLMKAWLDPAKRLTATRALARIVDFNAMEAYLAGLVSDEPALRRRCGEAILDLEVDAQHLVRRRLAAGTLPPEVVGELKRLYGGAVSLRTWELLGPFPHPFEEPFNPRHYFALDEVEGGRLYAAKHGREVKWTPVRPGDGGYVDLLAQWGPETRATAYGNASILSRQERRVEVELGGTDSLVLWFNGEEVHRSTGARTWRPDAFRIPVTLRAGANYFLVKSTQVTADWGFSLRVPGPEVAGLRGWTAPEGTEEDYLRSAGAEGSAERGLAVFRKRGCAACHDADRMGPDLAGVGGRLDRRALAEALLYPDRKGVEGFSRELVLLRTGRIYEGVARQVTAEGLVLHDLEGITRRLVAGEIVERRRTEGSPMPPATWSGLSRSEFADLLAFLATLK